MKTGLILIFGLLSISITACDNKSSNPPTETAPIRVTNPAAGAMIADPITVRAAAGSGYAFIRVDFYIDGDSVWTDNIAPYEYYWDVLNYDSTADHTIQAAGYTADSSYTSALVTASVSITPGLSFVSSYLPNSQQALGVTVWQNLMFISSGDPGLEVIDINVKTAPIYRSRFDSPGQAYKADIQSSTLNVVIADWDAGISRANFADPESLVQRGAFDTPGLAKDVVASGNYLYVADQDGLAIIDCSDPYILTPLQRVALPTSVNYVDIQGSLAFVTNSADLHIINVANPLSPSVLTSYNTPGSAQAVAVIDTFAFVADGTEGVLALSVADPANPRYLSRYIAGGSSVSTVDVGDSTVFAGTASGGIYALDYAQPDTLRLLDDYNTGNTIWQVNYDSHYLYVATSGNVYIFRFVR